MKFQGLFEDFVKYCRTQMEFPVVAKYATALETFAFAEAAHWGRVLHYVLHEYRTEFRGFLLGFVKSMAWCDDDELALFEIDCLNAYFPYRPTAFTVPQDFFRHIKIIGVDSARSAVEVEIPARCLPWIERYVEIKEGTSPRGRYRIEYIRNQMPYMPKRGLDHNANYCHAVAENVRGAMPRWRAI